MTVLFFFSVAEVVGFRIEYLTNFAEVYLMFCFDQIKEAYFIYIFMELKSLVGVCNFFSVK